MLSTLRELLSGSFLHQLVAGLGVTLELFVISWIAAMLLGVILMMVRGTGSRLAAFLVGTFVMYHRSVPTIVQILVWYFGVPQLLPDTWQTFINNHNAQFLFAAIALSLNAAAYISEDLRSGFRTLPHTQQEAARALGLSYLQSMRLILIPQALRSALPALIGQTLGLFKSTSLAMAIGVAELMYVARQIEGETYATFACFLIPTVVYFAGTSMIAFVGGLMQRRALHTLQR